MSYASPNDLLARYDAKRVGQLVRDDGTQAGPGELASDAVLAAALADASAVVDSCALAGGRYTAADLLALQADPVGSPLLLRVVCDLAYGLLVARRGAPAPDVARQAPRYADALKFLDDLRGGSRVFDVAGAIAAGQPAVAPLGGLVCTLSQKAHRLFGTLYSPHAPL